MASRFNFATNCESNYGQQLHNPKTKTREIDPWNLRLRPKWRQSRRDGILL